MIDLSYNVSGMFDDEALRTFDQNISIELSLKGLICHTMCEGCSMVNHCLHLIALVRRNSDYND